MERRLERLRFSLTAQAVPSRHTRTGTSSTWSPGGSSLSTCQLMNTSTSKRARLRSMSTEAVAMAVIDVVVTVAVLQVVMSTEADVDVVVEAVVVATNLPLFTWQTS